MKTRKITYRLIQVRNGRIYGESADNESLNLTLAMAQATQESGSSALILRNTYGPKGRVSSGRIVWASAEMKTDADIVAAPHQMIFGLDLIPPSYVKLFGHGALISAVAA
ncbi:MAG: hypothetical protein WC661_07170 [Opitutaceae bacterium]|jgi:hypothetical protein